MRKQSSSFNRNVIALTLISGMALSGCAQFETRNSASMPLGSMLEATADSRQKETPAPLALPASVAILFIPSSDAHIEKTTLHRAALELKQQLVTNTKYIRSVSVVSSDDVGGKTSLPRIRAMYDADIAIVLSYQQDQRNQQSGPGGLVDATVVGAFVAPTVKTITTTVVDAKIIHIANDAVIFRASGDDSRTTKATSFGTRGELADESYNGILTASKNLGEGLLATLSRFENYDMANAVPMNEFYASADSTKSPANANTWNSINSFKAGGGGTTDSLVVALLIAAALRRKITAI